MRKSTFKIILSVLSNKLESIYYGYEMDCLISAEFTPSPDYSDIATFAESLLAKYNSSLDEFKQWLYDQRMLWKHPYCSSPYDEIYSFLN